MSKEALDFETIEELWNYQLDGTGVTVAELREQGFVSLANAPRLMPREELQVPDPLGQDRDRERGPAAGRAAQPAALRGQGGAGRRSLPPADRADGDADARPVLQQPASQRESAGTGALDPPRPRPAAGYRRRRYRRSARGGAGAYVGRIKARVTPWIHPEAVFMLHGFGATVPLATAPSAAAWPTSACRTASSTTSTRPAGAAP